MHGIFGDRSARSVKRQRASTNSGPSPPTAVFDYDRTNKRIESLDNVTIRLLLITAAKSDSSVDRLIENECEKQAAQERAIVRDFDYLSENVWETLNNTYADMRDSHAFEMVGEASESIEECFDIIRRDCPLTASFKTKDSALETCRKIGKAICLSNGAIGHEVRNDQWNDNVSKTMMPIVESLTESELESLRPWCNEKLVELSGIAESYAIFEDLQNVVDLFRVDDSNDSEDEDDQNDEGEDLQNLENDLTEHARTWKH